MKSLLLLSLFSLSTPLWALIDSQIDIKPNVKYMNYFFDGYLPWYKEKFNFAPTLESPQGDRFLHKAIYKLDHWKIPERKELDQILIGQGFKGGTTPFYTFRIYIHKDLRDHSFIKAQKLSIAPLFIEKNPNGEICYLGKLQSESIDWTHVPKSKNSFYLGHFCGGNSLKYISQVANGEIPFFNPFTGQSEYELRTFSDKSLISVLYFVKNTHTAIIPKKHVPYINAHGEKLLLPFDKYSVDKKGELIIYYP